jgi:hypothetical protein
LAVAAMLSAGREVLALEAARFRGRELRRDPWVLAGTFDDPAPAGVARHVDHRREGHRDPVSRRLLGGRARSLFPKARIKRAGFRERNRKDRMVAVNDVETQQQGNAKARFFHCEPLDRAHLFGAPEIQQPADSSGANALGLVAPLAGAGHRAKRCRHVELPDLFFECHCRQQSVNASHALASCRWGWFKRAISTKS